MNILHLAVLLTLSSFFLSGCAVYHSYGPYKGKLIDEQTEEPIEGAAVYFEFYTEGIYSTGKYANATEKVTDKNGEFKIDEHLIFVFPRPFHEWVDNGIVVIFKPGFSAYRTGTAKFELSKPNADNDYSVIKLKKLKNIQERTKNLANLYISDEVPKRKYKKLRELKKTEYENTSVKSK